VHWYVADETNNDATPGQFFIYGGLVIREDQFSGVDRLVSEIRHKYGYEAGNQFKFHTRSRPEQVSIEQARLAKQELVEGLGALDVRMIVYVILHDIAQPQNRMNFALNTVVWAFHRLLEAESATGVMLIDRDDERHAHLAGLFQHGLTIDGNVIPVSDRVKFFGMTSDNASNVSSAVDITLGAFRFCVNAAGGEGNDAVARDIFPPLAKLLWQVEERGVSRVGGYGFYSRPATVQVRAYREKYSHLFEALAEYSDAAVD
jgi:hypothetical protein